MAARVRRTGYLRRRKFGDASPPKFFEYDDVTGLHEVTLDFVEWNAGIVQDPLTSEDVLNVVLIDVDSSSAARLKILTLSHVQIDGLYYQWKGTRKALGRANDWVVRTAISGDKKAVV